ncbi:MAG TPA: radical SAM protein [Acidobacteriaceae bacterium]|jgi:DNA repair photolyase|nr:radical SAM protein [Acidobacteriaceae bacterium]
MTGEEKANTPTLFPIVQAALTGMSRLAAEAAHADDGYLVEFRAMEARSMLSRVNSKRQLLLDYSINPYRGCEFGCKYCYARYTHEFMAPKEAGPTTVLSTPEAFERVIFMKQNAAWLVEQELKRVDPRMFLAIGTATDPYQPIERRAKITRSILEVFARKQGYQLGIVTKSNLVVRDIDLLEQISARNTLTVHLTITTPDAALARKLEPRAPRPDLRFEAVRRLREQGIAAGVFCSPLMPGINDAPRDIDRMARRAAEAGALFFSANPLFLKPCSRDTYFEFVRQHFPQLLPDYEKRFGKAEFAAPEYRRELSVTVRDACRRYGLRHRADDASVTLDGRKKPIHGEQPVQSSLAIGRSA